MKRYLTVGVLVLAAALVAKSAVSRAAMVAVERSMGQRLEKLSVGEPFLVLSPPLGVYLEGYGAVFTAELNLVPSGITPFRPSYTKEELARIRLKKLERLPVLKVAMREMLMSSAASLDTVPSDQQLVLGVALFHHPWEDRTGLPSQILMQAPRRALVELHTNQRDRSAADTVIKTQEF